MKYSEAINSIKQYRKILVSGPQRSGTTIAGKIISHDCDLKYIDETKINCWDKDMAIDMIISGNDFVLQCPGICAWLHELTEPDVLIVFMLREVKEIIESEKRVKWNWQGEEYEEYKKAFWDDPGMAYYQPIASHKYIIWEAKQRKQIKNYVELDYHSLDGHPLWVPKDKRVGFKAKQTEV